MESRINKYPYFLWLNKDTNIEINNKVSIIYEGKETDLKRVSKYEILALKHLPVFIIFYFTFNIPGIKDFIIGTLVFFLLAFIFIKYLVHLQKVLFLFMFLGWYLVWNNNALQVEQIISVVAQLSLISFMAYDINNLLKRDHYYYLKNIHTPVTVKGTRKYPWLINKIFRTESKKINWVNLVLPGFYIKLQKEIQ